MFFKIVSFWYNEMFLAHRMKQMRPNWNPKKWLMGFIFDCYII